MLSAVLKSARAANSQCRIAHTRFSHFHNFIFSQLHISSRFHDRFLIIDKTTLIHVGASLNHLGKRCFAFSSLDKSSIPDILAKV